MPEPIELTEKDLIERTDKLAVTGKPGAPPGFLQQIKDGIQQVKEVKKILDDLGINLGDLGINFKKEAGKPSTKIESINTPSPAQQFNLFLRVLQARYGDITINELLEKLKAEFGTRKISQLIGGQ